MGTGAASPSRAATEAATANSADESLPPEKLTRQGGRRSPSSTIASMAAKGDSWRPAPGQVPVRGREPTTIPVETSSSSRALSGTSGPSPATPAGDRSHPLTESCEHVAPVPSSQRHRGHSTLAILPRPDRRCQGIRSLISGRADSGQCDKIWRNFSTECGRNQIVHTPATQGTDCSNSGAGAVPASETAPIPSHCVVE